MAIHPDIGVKISITMLVQSKRAAVLMAAKKSMEDMVSRGVSGTRHPVSRKRSKAKP